MITSRGIIVCGFLITVCYFAARLHSSWRIVLCSAAAILTASSVPLFTQTKYYFSSIDQD